jgi:23S rRNA (pseudouridine1915-N3)-methyltransferase
VQLSFLWIGTTRDPRYSELERRYFDRIRKLVPARLSAVSELRKHDPRAQAAQLGREEEALRRRIGAGSYLVSLDERGREMESAEFASFLGGMLSRPVDRLTFVVGGFLGIPEGILAQSDLKLMLSRFTLPHELARVVLLEQVYRALTILKGMSYHK